VLSLSARLYTIGHSRHSPEQLRDLLGGCGVTKVVDVRRIPFSRFNPQFNRERLARDLQQHGIAYQHLENLGGLRDPAAASASRDTGWQNPFFRSYADYARTKPFLEALDSLGLLAVQQPSAIMCAEADWRQCHRQIIADYMIVREFEVRHILVDGSTEPARLTPFASIAPDGTLTYSRTPDQQLPLDLG
jgi:uncharacterized protein (DUF488 family)